MGDVTYINADVQSPKPNHLAMFSFFLLLLGVACACYSSHLAKSKGHAAGPWALGGLFLGPVALLAAIGLPDLKLQRYLRLLAEHQGALEAEAEAPSSQSWGWMK